MKRIMLTRQKYALVDNKDFDYLSQWKWYFAPTRDKSGYAQRTARVDGKRRELSMAREILNAPKGLTVDHINGDKLDNRRINLRIATYQQNQANVSRRMGASGYRGVHQVINRWIARIKFDKKTKYLGSFKNPIDAAKAYNEAAIKYFGEFARINTL